jgi:hypothetical protein
MRSILTVSILGVALALGGCAADANDSSATNETGEANEALSALGTQLVGAYQFGVAKGNYEEYDHLTLDKAGSYTADKPNPTHGAALPESGTWTTSGGRLVLHPEHAFLKHYDVSVAADGSGMKLTRFGNTEKFDRVAPVACADDGDCTAGQECHFVSICPSAPGTVHCMAGRNLCVTVAHANESCGFRTQSVDCARGLDCVHAAGTPLDALTCLPHVAQYGESCGGFIRNAPQCDAGLVCSHIGSDGHLINPDLPGVCRAGEGSTCGGNIQGAHECASPLHCAFTNPDIGGVCAQ